MPGSVTGTDMRSDDNAYEKPEILSAVEKTLAKFGEVEDEDSTPVQTEDSADASDSTPVSGGDTKPAETEDSTPTDSEDDPADDSSSADDKTKPAIPDNYYRAAIHQGWKPEQLSKLYESDPDGTLKFLEKIYNDVNNLSQQFALLGRKAKELQAHPVTPVQPEQPKAFDPKKFKEMYEDDPATAIASMFEAMQQAKAQSVSQPAAKSTSRDEMQERLATLEQVNGFFSADDMSAFGEHYGKSKKIDWSDLTPGQHANRQAVINRADEILDGAEVLGVKMTIREAIERAHLETAAPMLQQIVRNDLLKKVQKKASGVTLRPSKGKSKSASTGGKLTEAQAVANAEKRLAELRAK